MSRKFERILVTLLGTWQILDGSLTILFYGLSKRKELGQLADRTTAYGKAMGVFADNLFIVISTFGIFLIGLGLFHLVVAKQYIKDQTVIKKIGYWLLCQSIISCLILDIPSVILGISAAVIIMAKNKSISLELKT